MKRHILFLILIFSFLSTALIAQTGRYGAVVVYGDGLPAYTPSKVKKDAFDYTDNLTGLSWTYTAVTTWSATGMIRQSSAPSITIASGGYTYSYAKCIWVDTDDGTMYKVNKDGNAWEGTAGNVPVDNNTIVKTGTTLRVDTTRKTGGMSTQFYSDSVAQKAKDITYATALPTSLPTTDALQVNTANYDVLFTKVGTDMIAKGGIVKSIASVVPAISVTAGSVTYKLDNILWNDLDSNLLAYTDGAWRSTTVYSNQSEPTHVVTTGVTSRIIDRYYNTSSKTYWRWDEQTSAYVQETVISETKKLTALPTTVSNKISDFVIVQTATDSIAMQYIDANKYKVSAARMSSLPNVYTASGSQTIDYSNAEITVSNLKYKYDAKTAKYQLLEGQYVAKASFPTLGASNTLITSIRASDDSALYIVKKAVGGTEKYFRQTPFYTSTTPAITEGSNIDNSEAIWKNPNISIASGQTVDFSYQNNAWKPIKELYVDDFGADSTGVADSYAAIMKMQNYYNLVRFKKGGTYKLSQALTALSNSVIEGNGATLKIPVTGYNVLEITGKTNVRINDLTLEGDNNSTSAAIAGFAGGVSYGNGARVINSENIIFSNCVFKNNTSNGIEIENTKDITIQNCISIGTFYGTSVSADYNAYINVEDVKLLNCKAYSNTSQGITVGINGGYYNNIIIDNCTVSPRNSDGTALLESAILLRNGIMIGYSTSLYSAITNSIISNCYIENCGSTGIFISYNNSKIYGNTVVNCGFHGQAYATSATILNGESIRGGILFASPRSIDCYSNKVYRTRDGQTTPGTLTLIAAIKVNYSNTYPYPAMDSSYLKIHDNIIDGSDGNGLSVFYAFNNTEFYNNTVMNCKGYDLQIRNDISDNNYLYSQVEFRNNKIKTMGKGGLQFTPAKSNLLKIVIKDNEFENKTGLTTIDCIQLGNSGFIIGDTLRYISEGNTYKGYRRAYFMSYNATNDKAQRNFVFKNEKFYELTHIMMNATSIPDSAMYICQNCTINNNTINTWSYRPVMIEGNTNGDRIYAVGNAHISWNASYYRPNYGFWKVGDEFKDHATGITYRCTTAGLGGTTGASVWVVLNAGNGTVTFNTAIAANSYSTQQSITITGLTTTTGQGTLSFSGTANGCVITPPEIQAGSVKFYIYNPTGASITPNITVRFTATSL